MKKILVTLAALWTSMFVLAQSDYHQIRIDPAQAYGTTYGQIFDTIQLITLEDTKHSGINLINNLYVTEDRYIIYDYLGGCILFFDKQGKYKAKIDKLPGVQLPDMLRSILISDFSVDKQRKEVVIVTTHFGDSDASKYFYIFDFDGNFLRKEPILLDSNTYICLDNGQLLVATEAHSLPQKESLHPHQLYVLKNGKIVRRFLPITTEQPSEHRFTTTGEFFTNGVTNFYIPMFSSQLYEISSDGFLKDSLRMILPSVNALPTHLLSDSLYRDWEKVDQYFKEHPQTIQKISKVHKVKNYLFFEIQNEQINTRIDKNRYFFYHLQRQILHSLYHIQPDATCMYIPINTDNVIGVDAHSLYVSLSADTLIELKESMLKSGAVFTKALETFFATKDKNSNPVILQLKFK